MKHRERTMKKENAKETHRKKEKTIKQKHNKSKTMTLNYIRFNNKNKEIANERKKGNKNKCWISLKKTLK